MESVAVTESEKGEKKGLTIERYFTVEGISPMDEVTWTLRDAVIKDAKGEVIFEQKGVEVPASWSLLATNVVASKYFRGAKGGPERETSVRHLIGRVVNNITNWGLDGGYFKDSKDTHAFRDELTHLLVRQKMSFNSPVWFNVGAVPHPQASACFIQPVEDTMDSIMALAASEARLFKQGSGTGSNLSKIRGSMEHLSAGGFASGPVSFMRGYDSFAGVIKSGGRTRRAAKMVILNADHPDIEDFIDCKAEEERRARILIDGGVSAEFNQKGSAYESVGFQNANHSVRVTDSFMHAVEKNEEWTLIARVTGKAVKTVRARALWDQIARAAWACGDPGLQFDTTVNEWNPCARSDRINASNPCSEFMFLDNTACNLASLNLMHFRRLDGSFDTEAFSHAVRTTFLAMEILVSNASYPTKEIGEMSERFRPLGIGYANLGALLMSKGLPYDSDEGRRLAAAITSLMSAEAYAMSGEIASVTGPFAAYEENREPFLDVLAKHAGAHARLSVQPLFGQRDLLLAGEMAWSLAIRWAQGKGIRNAQASLIAPTGTIGFMMDVDTTGVEPDLALVKRKKLVGGGEMKIVNQSVPLALHALGYDEALVRSIMGHVHATGTLDGAAGFRERDFPVFDTALGKNAIPWQGHVKMMAAVQPFLSGAISKTVNMPADSTVEDIEAAYALAWKSGLKSIAIYRDGCKSSQPLTAGEKVVESKTPPLPVAVRRRLPDERRSVTHKFSVGGHEGYMTVGLYDDGTPGELFVRMAKEGSTVAGLMDTLATAVSMALQYGVPLRSYVEKFSHVRFEPSGFTKDPRIGYAKSVADYIFRWIGVRFLGDAAKPTGEPVNGNGQPPDITASAAGDAVMDAPPCPACGSIMLRNGTCHRCPNCGLANGCS